MPSEDGHQIGTPGSRSWRLLLLLALLGFLLQLGLVLALVLLLLMLP